MTTPRSDIELEATRLLWREQVTELPRAAWHALRRLLRREPRWYLTIDGMVAARFTSEADHAVFMGWLVQAHTSTFDFGFNTGKEFLVAQHIAAADAGHDRTA